MLFLVGCSKEIPEGDIKNFVDRLDFDLAYQFVNTGKSITTVSYYVDKKLEGQISTEMYIDKSNDMLYHYSNNNASGRYYGDEEGQYQYKNQKTLSYIDNEGKPIVYQLEDGVYKDLSYTKDDIQTAVTSFFYTELDGGYHRSGFYYGDYIKMNCAKYYEYFSLNEEKTELTYSINTLSTSADGDDILTMHRFTVNQYGLLISLSTTAKNNAKKIISETTIFVEYNINFEKLSEL